MIEIETYESVGALKFGSTLEVSEKILGHCDFEKVNRLGEIERFYKDFTVRFSADQKVFCECTFHYGTEVSLNGSGVDWSREGLLELCKKDANSFERCGTVVLLDLGVTLTGIDLGAESDRTITAFSRGLWNSEEG